MIEAVETMVEALGEQSPSELLADTDLAGDSGDRPARVITSRAASRRCSGVYVFLLFVPIMGILPDRPAITRVPPGQCPESAVNLT